jgi:uncharacterized membrane protein
MAITIPSLVLILLGVGFVGFGVAYALRPDSMAALTDLTLASPTARTDFVATYGGFQVGFGLFLLACAAKTSWQEPGLWAAVAALAGFGSFRALAIARHRGRVRNPIWFGLGLELCGLAIGLLAIGLQGHDGSVSSTCQVYRPHLAKQTFDGRVGAVLLHNATSAHAELKVYHPDGVGDVELRRRVAPGAVLALAGNDGGRLTLGNDWGIQVDESCVATLGQAAAWTPGEFSLRWDGQRLQPETTP